MMEQAGAAAVAVHGRTRKQMYAGSQLGLYPAVREAVSVPVIANGDVFTPEAAVRILRYTGADMAMVGRGVFVIPGSSSSAPPRSPGRRSPLPAGPAVDTAVRQFEINAAHKGERWLCLEARRHYAWYLKGVPYAGYYKEQISKISTMEDIYKVTEGIKRDLQADACSFRPGKGGACVHAIGSGTGQTGPAGRRVCLRPRWNRIRAASITWPLHDSQPGRRGRAHPGGLPHAWRGLQ